MNMKRIALPAAFLLVVSLLLAGAAGGADNGTYAGFPVARLLLNGSPATPDSPPVIINGRTYVPLRFVSESLGASVAWDEAGRTVSIDTAPLPPEDIDTPLLPPEDKEPPISASGKGVTVTIVSASADSRKTRLRLRIQNNANVKVYFPAAQAKIVAGEIKLDHPGDYDSAFSEDILPGETREGELDYPALPLITREFKVFVEVFLNSSVNSFAPVFTVRL